MIFIFKGFDKDALVKKITGNSVVLKFTEFAKSNRIKLKNTSIILLGICTLTATLLSLGVTVGVKVNYSGKDMGIVEDQSVFENAINIAAGNISSSNAKNAIKKPKYSLTLTIAGRFQNSKGLAEKIITNTNDIQYASALLIDGEIVAVTKSDELADLLEARRTAFYIDGAKNNGQFLSKVDIEHGYYLKSEINSTSDIEKIVDGLDVKTESVVNTKSAIPYKTVKKTSAQHNAGYSKVEVVGCMGTSVKSEAVESLNGAEISRKVLSDEVVTKPVNKVVVIGTAIEKTALSSRNVSSGLICPLNKGSYVISSYFGDGRNHKAMDFSAPRGTPIYAAGGGTVTYAGYDSDFGYNVVIKHSNGISTRYAHANSLNVSYGQVVSQGDMIATVGTTGWSTGNHLHFEVIVNGVRVNPAPYIGM